MSNIFEEVKDRLDIRQVIEHYGFKVNRAGKFVCPFHNDHKPSASIKNDYFNCFTCGAGGDLITFTAKYLGLSNIDAAKELVRVFNLNIDISTAEERKAQYIAEKKRREEVKKQASLRGKFAKDKEIRAERKAYTNYKLRNEIRQKQREKEQAQREYVDSVGVLLADMHRYYNDCIHLYPFDDERHIKALQELTVCEYYLECYDADAERFCAESGEVIKRYGEELSRVRTSGGSSS